MGRRVRRLRAQTGHRNVTLTSENASSAGRGRRRSWRQLTPARPSQTHAFGLQPDVGGARWEQDFPLAPCDNRPDGGRRFVRAFGVAQPLRRAASRWRSRQSWTNARSNAKLGLPTTSERFASLPAQAADQTQRSADAIAGAVVDIAAIGRPLVLRPIEGGPLLARRPGLIRLVSSKNPLSRNCQQVLAEPDKPLKCGRDSNISLIHI